MARTYTKRARCERCENDRAHLTAVESWDPDDDRADKFGFVPSWKCECCGAETPRRVNKRSEGLTPSQVKALDKIKTTMLANSLETSPREVEVKEWDVNNSDSNRAYVLCEVGMVGDEGSLAAVFCRDRRHFAVGRRGKLVLLNARDGKRRTGRAVFYTRT